MIGANIGSFSPTTTMTRSQYVEKARIIAERNVPLPEVPLGHGSSALSRPMRDDSPAARITPQKSLMFELVRRLAAQQLAQVAPRAAHGDVECPEQRIDRADFVEAHFVD